MNTPNDYAKIITIEEWKGMPRPIIRRTEMSMTDWDYRGQRQNWNPPTKASTLFWFFIILACGVAVLWAFVDAI